MLVIFLILYTMFRSAKWAVLILVSVLMASIGGPLALFITHTNFSVSSAVGFLALFGVSVETGVIMIEFINQLRSRRKGMESLIENTLLKPPSRAQSPVASRDDDHAGGHTGSTARRAFSRHRILIRSARSPS